MKRALASVFTALVMTTGVVVATASTAQAADVGVNMNQACQINHGAGYVAELTYPGAYGWRCWVPPWGVRKGVSVQAYCNYFGLGTAVVLDPNNAYSWRCRS